MLTFHEHKFSDRTAFWVMDGERHALAKARPIVSGGYLLAASGMCWMDPRAREVNRVTRSVDARYLWVRTAREARRMLRELVAQDYGPGNASAQAMTTSAPSRSVCPLVS
jgi:hypothetical protein